MGQALPCGNEGAGTVVAAGSSPAAQALLGKTVATLGGAMYAQYRTTKDDQCLVLPPGTRAADGASCFVNPLTALGMGAYAASKSGVARLTEAMAEEFKDRGITVNAVLPSILDTPANRSEMPGADPARWVSPDALAQVIAFLLSDAAAPINGALIPVKGRV